MKFGHKNGRKIFRGRPNMGESETGEDVTTGPSTKVSHPYVRAPTTGMSRVKSRKELRKQQRKAKKAQKHQFFLVKCGREDLVLKGMEALVGKKKKKKSKKKKAGNHGGDNDNKKTNEGDDAPDAGSDKPSSMGKDNNGKNNKKRQLRKDVSSDDDEDEDEKFVRESVKNKLEKRENIDLAEELKREKKKMRKEMDEDRKKRLLEENEQEEKTIKQLAKMLKLKSKAKIPASFRTDGLDFVLEACEQASTDKKKEKSGDSDSDDDVGSGSEGEQNEMESMEFDDEENEEQISLGDDDDGLNESDFEGDEDMEEDGNLDEEIFGEESDLEEDIDSDSELSENVENAEEEQGEPSKKKMEKNKKPKAIPEEKVDDGVWEDIYGRLRSKDGAVLNNNTVESKPAQESGTKASGKYVPPALRGNQSQREKLAKQLKGLMNRLSESNMHSIANQVEEMYMANSRNEMNQTLFELLCAALIRPTLTPERVILEHVMLIAILHANVGTEVGAFFIQSFTQEFKSKYDNWDSSEDEEHKQLENLALVISFIYHFKIVDACLIYDILKFLSDRFNPKDVEIILNILRSIGFRLRKDDPAALKELIVNLQQKASKQQSGGAGNAKVKFMLEILMAIRNNNMNKIPNYDPSFGEHLLKIVKSHLRPGNYVSEMKIGLKDLLNADKAGRWWIVGSAWAGNELETGSMNPAESANTTARNSEDAVKHAKLLKRARAQGINTDTRRNIFCILMTAEDYMDAFEKLNHLGLRNNQDREIMHVTTYCCLQEKKFNPYYALIASRFCTTDRKLMLALQFNLWDRLKDLDSLASHQRNNLASLLVHLINDKSLPLSILKVIEYAEMDKIKLKFLKKILTGILMQKDTENLQEIFMKPAKSEKLGLFRESLRLFLNHFMLQTSISTTDGSIIKTDLSPEEMEALRGRVKIAEKCMSMGKSSLVN